MSPADWGVPVLQSVLAPASPEAQSIARLWWLFFWLSVAIWLLVVSFTALALARRSRTRAEAPLLEPGPERRLVRSTGAATLLTALLLVGLLVASVSTGQTLRQLGSDPGGAALHIKVTGQRWWWQIEYPAEPVSQSVESANELHVPVGRPVVLELTSHDVIHSLWLPDLQGKRDLIPGVQTQLRFTASREGTFRGQCAEYCGVQHA